MNTPDAPAIARTPRTGTGRRAHRAWWVAAVALLVVVGGAVLTAAAGLLVEPLHTEYAWSRSSIALASSVNMVLYGLVAPFAAALMDRFGLHRIAVAALALVATGTLLTTVMSSPWQFTLYWGLLVGAGTGAVAMTFAAAVAQRWFVARRGLVLGTLTGASAFGQMAFLPAVAWTVDHQGWRPALVTLALTVFVLAALAALVLRDHPADVGLRPYGADPAGPVHRPEPAPGAARRTVAVLAGALRGRRFALLAGVFMVCGASTNGLMWTHFVPAAQDHGMAVTVAAALVSGVGVFSLLGTVVSGWLTDRVDPRWLLAGYFAGRALLLAVLPTLLGPHPGPGLMAFVVAFGLLDVATVPPVIMLCNRYFGDDGAIVFGWVNATHQLGAGAAAALGGTIRDTTGGYGPLWLFAALLCGLAVAMVHRLPAREDGQGPSSRAPQ
ncbi:MFS transporter [Nocardiopsis kunsanensis]|uniref:MFS transporter n=1 Tax=Nocardiopsis kunsanensis TaxID=141693 RepID=A0A918XD94_9ACTN|nr:MFS transporter [Nocardiopsis kunsanensis]GHD25871.1 MFS transporter [Nocardiopsis kunsanensis]